MKAEDWIKVSDRLPENDDLVVVCVHELLGYEITPLFDLARYIGGRWVCNGLRCIEPTYWTPIECPKED